MKRIAATYYGQVVGFLVPLKDLETALNEGAINHYEEMSLTDFRAQMTECWERLQIDVDCIYLNYHNRRAAAFVSPRMAMYLPIPISDVAHKLLAVDSGLIKSEAITGEESNNV